MFLSNGPGDPAALPYVYPTVRALIDRKTLIFGICLGHQILGHALGGTTYKLKFGHRGGNQPVLNQPTGRVEITAQNHGFAVDTTSPTVDEIDFSHVRLNDRTCSGRTGPTGHGLDNACIGKSGNHDRDTPEIPRMSFMTPQTGLGQTQPSEARSKMFQAGAFKRKVT